MSDHDRETFLKVIKPEWASSESEAEDNGEIVFKRYPISWRSKRLVKGLHSLDKEAKKIMSKTAQRQYVRRITGETVEKSAPKNLESDLLWIKS